MEGCAHGELPAILDAVKDVERVSGEPVDLLICCGDFQAIRNEADLETMSCPMKYRSMGSFWKYYCGQATPHIPVLFVGGNHEASSHMLELPLGGWAAPGIYYLGQAGSVLFGGLRISGFSGIFKHADFTKGHHERNPLGADGIRSVYHVREHDIARISAFGRQYAVDIMVSHDWPAGISRFGDQEGLLRYKPLFRSDIESNRLGNPAAMNVLMHVQPRFWLAAHLHVKFAAVVRHADSDPARPAPGTSATPEGVGARSESSQGRGHVPRTTRFLALDKAVPRRQFLQVVQVPVPQHVVECAEQCLKTSSSTPAELHPEPWLVASALASAQVPAESGRSEDET